MFYVQTRHTVCFWLYTTKENEHVVNFECFSKYSGEKKRKEKDTL